MAAQPAQFFCRVWRRTRLAPALTAAWRHRTLVIPAVLAVALTASASGFTLLRVHRGDTLSAIAARYHTTVARLVALNNLPGNGDLIIAGEQLRIPGQAARTRHTSRIVTIHHTVVAGDTLYGLAQRYHVPASTIAGRNHLPSSNIVVLGQTLAIPHRERVSTGPSGTSSGSSQVERARSYLAQRSEPNRAQTEALIRSTAQQWGVDPSLALAIAWQESGWQMREVSPVGAVGVMQVMPYTGAYLSTNVAHRSLDLYDAHDNITAGVALLSVLTHEASSTSQAIAAYYQGLGSVREHGQYDSTKQYVADVNTLKQSF